VATIAAKTIPVTTLATLTTAIMELWTHCTEGDEAPQVAVEGPQFATNLSTKSRKKTSGK
jgi:hypothetical protein